MDPRSTGSPTSSMLDELHALEGSALTPALCETVRLLESGKFERLRDSDLHEIANYRAADGRWRVLDRSRGGCAR